MTMLRIIGLDKKIADDPQMQEPTTIAGAKAWGLRRAVYVLIDSMGRLQEDENDNMVCTFNFNPGPALKEMATKIERGDA